MLSLESPLWSALSHAYGDASDIPELLRQLTIDATSKGENEPWYSIWSALAHQGDVYSASFAAVPHVMRVLKQAPLKADYSFFHFPAWVEVCRQEKSVPIPRELEAPYFAALSELPSLIAIAAGRDWDADFLCIALSALAVAKGYASVSRAVLELNPETADKFMQWFYQQ